MESHCKSEYQRQIGLLVKKNWLLKLEYFKKAQKMQSVEVRFYYNNFTFVK
jgi:hypothetical protein